MTDDTVYNISQIFIVLYCKYIIFMNTITKYNRRCSCRVTKKFLQNGTTDRKKMLKIDR